MLNWRRIAVTGMVAGMMAVTACSTNLPETNQGNRNGQHVVDSVNRRPDTYRTTSNRLGFTENNDGMVGRTTRGIRRAAHNVANPAHGTTRNTTRSNSLNIGRPQGRIGNTFHYGNHRGYTTGLNNHRTGDYSYYENYTSDGAGYDYGVSATDRALVNNRTTRSAAVAPAVTPGTEKTETKRVDTKRNATPDKPAKSAKPAAKKAETKKTETKTETSNVTRSAPVAAPAAPAVPKTHAAPKAAPKTTVNRATRSHTNRVERNHVQSRSQARHIAPNTMQNTMQNTTVAPNRAQTNRYGMNHSTNRPNRAARRNNNVNRNTNVNRYNGINMVTPMDQTVAVVNNEDNAIFNNDDLAFFRKKTEEPTNTVPNVPPAVTPNAPAPTPMPAPRVESYNDAQFFNNSFDNNNGFDNSFDNNNINNFGNGSDNGIDNGLNNNYNQYAPHHVPVAPVKMPARNAATRIAK